MPRSFDPGQCRDAVDDVLRLFSADGGLELTVRGVSMEPRLPAGTRIRLSRFSRALPGDVVVLRMGGGLVVHRLLGAAPRKGGWRLLTQGDASPRPDGWSDPARVVGVAELPCSPAERLKAIAAFAAVVARGLRRRLRR